MTNADVPRSPIGERGFTSDADHTVGRDLVKGALAGAVAWYAMDQVLRFMYNHEGPRVREQEDRARNRIPALEVMAERIAESFGISLSDTQRQAGGTILQWVTGIGGGALYGVLRGRLPGVTAGRGLAYGAAFSLVVDEAMTPLFGLSPGPLAFPWQTHVRGFAGHLVYGVVLEASMEEAER